MTKTKALKQIIDELQNWAGEDNGYLLIAYTKGNTGGESISYSIRGDIPKLAGATTVSCMKNPNIHNLLNAGVASAGRVNRDKSKES